MIKLLERLDIHMPQYNDQIHPKYGKIKVIPTSFRRIRFLRGWPYFVGDKVSFVLKMEKAPENTHSHYKAVIYERFSSEEAIWASVEDNNIRIDGNVIPREGDIEYSLGIADTRDKRYVVFTAKVINKDRAWMSCAGAFVGAILTVITGLILGAIAVDKMWHIWNPFK